VTNALKHAFPPDRPGTIAVRIAKRAEHVSIIVMDDGLGMSTEEAATKSFGTALVRSLSRQLGGTVVWTAARPGTHVKVQVSLARDGADA
jgi:two-component sensor histidine kinase